MSEPHNPRSYQPINLGLMPDWTVHRLAVDGDGIVAVDPDQA